MLIASSKKSHTLSYEKNDLYPLIFESNIKIKQSFEIFMFQNDLSF